MNDFQEQLRQPYTRDLWSGLSAAFEALPKLKVLSIGIVPPMQLLESQAFEQVKSHGANLT